MAPAPSGIVGSKSLMFPWRPHHRRR